MDGSETPLSPPDVLHVAARPDQTVLIGRAADRLGLSRSEFVLDAACREAEDLVLDQVYFPLERQGYARFVAALEHPPEPGVELLDLVRAKSPWE